MVVWGPHRQQLRVRQNGASVPLHQWQLVQNVLLQAPDQQVLAEDAIQLLQVSRAPEKPDNAMHEGHQLFPNGFIRLLSAPGKQTT